MGHCQHGTHLGPRAQGERCVGYAPQGHWHTTTFVCALSAQGLLAPLVLDAPINGAAFVAWSRQFLVPELRAGDTPGCQNSCRIQFFDG